VAPVSRRWSTRDELPEQGSEDSSYLKAMKQRWIMPCAASESVGGHAVLGCRETFCPAGSSFEATAAKKEGCQRWCQRTEALFCETVCEEEGPECEECRRHCEAACQCEDKLDGDGGCQALAQDAALCVEQGGRWIPRNQNFDTVGNAFMTLFEISTTEGWVDVMYWGTDSRGPMMEPERDVFEALSMFFVAFIFVGSFFVLNLCVGVIVDSFNEEKRRVGGDQGYLLTAAQQKWVQAQRALTSRRIFFSLQNLDEISYMRRAMFFFINKSAFEHFIMGCIMLNTVVMGMAIFPWPSAEYVNSLQLVNYVLFGVFVVEAFLKLFALRLNYFHDGWNVFDFFCVLLSTLGIVLNELTDLKVGTVMSTIRLLRVARLFRLLHFAPGLNQLFNTFILSIPKLLNIGVLLILLTFLFSVLGVHLFATVQDNGALGVHANFRSFYRAALTLTRSMTGEAWNELMHSLTKGPDYHSGVLGKPCMPDFQDLLNVEGGWALLNEKGYIESPNGCGTAMAYVYFVSYTVLISFVVLNLLIAVILEGFEETSSGEETKIVERCIDDWKEFDPNFTLEVDLAGCFQFVDKVHSWYQQECNARGRRLTFRILDNGRLDLTSLNVKFIHQFKLKLTERRTVHIMQAVLFAIRVLISEGASEVLQDFDELEQSTLSSDPELVKWKRKIDMHGSVDFSVEVAAVKIQTRFKEWRAAACEVVSERHPRSADSEQKGELEQATTTVGESKEPDQATTTEREARADPTEQEEEPSESPAPQSSEMAALPRGAEGPEAVSLPGATEAAGG